MHCSVTLCYVDAPRDLQINPKKSNYQAGDKIRCSAEGNPKPSIQWRDLVNGTVIQGAVLVVSDDILVNSYTFQCIASNEYNGEKHTITYNITLTDKGSSIVYYLLEPKKSKVTTHLAHTSAVIFCRSYFLN